MKESVMELQKTTSRTSLLNSMILKAWRERWTDSLWGINIKTVLPRGVSGDVYNLADCILQQAVIGSNANPLVLSYLKHSLCAHLISHAAVLKRISRFIDFEKVFCTISLLEFLESIIDGVTCRNKAEEAVIAGSVASIVYWLMQIFSNSLQKFNSNRAAGSEHEILIDRSSVIIEKITKNDFILGIFYIGKYDDVEFAKKIADKYSEIKNLLINTGYIPSNTEVQNYLKLLASIDVEHLDMVQLSTSNEEPITYCVQPLLTVEVLLNPSSDTQIYASELMMVQRLKNYTLPRLLYETIRAGLISLSNVIETPNETMWGAFTFFKVPHILRQLHELSAVPADSNSDHIPEVVEAIEMLLEDTSILDVIDTKCACNTIEYLLGDWAKQHLVNDKQIKHFSQKREAICSMLQKREPANQSPSIINFVIRAEAPLGGILKTLSADYNKVQEALLGVLGQVLVGNTFELIISVATVEGKLKTFVARLIMCNENSKQIPGESSRVRSTLFDISFLMLTFIVQTYGADVVLSENGDSFFEKWVRMCMVERNKMKSPKQMVAMCDESIVDELLLTLSKPEAQIKTSNLNWQDICLNIPGVLYQVIIAWENETISSADVKSILDSIKRKLFSYSVCAASYLCAYMQTVREDEILKPLNMLQQFLTTLSPEEISAQDNSKERLGLTFQIIRKMQQDFHPSGNAKIRSQNIVSNLSLSEHFRDAWEGVGECGWLPVKSAQTLESLLQAGGPVWLVERLVDQILKCQFTRDMMKIMDIAFAVMHLDMEKTTIALLEEVIPRLVFANGSENQLSENQSFVLAHLCVYAIVSNLEMPQQFSKKRTRRCDSDESDLACNATKLRKLSESPDNSSSSDFVVENADANDPPVNLKDNLQCSIQYLFKVFSQFVATDELSPPVYFIFQFITLLVECGKDRVKAILKFLPNNLIQNLLKVMVTDDIKVGLVCRLYDLRLSSGRQSAVADLSLLRNINLRKQSLHL